MVSSKLVVSELYRSCNAQTTEEKKKEESMDWDWRKFGWEEIEIETETELTEGRIRDTLLAGWGKNIGNGEILLGNGGNKSEEKSKKVVRKSRVSSPRSPKGSNNLTCLVDDCEEDLSHCKDYHRRHRVCEHHSKIPVVFVRGEENRFCQQCSRFHSLGEFDEAKRSCRKRLDGHNQRRRKGQPESLYLTSEDFPSNFKGPQILQFSSPQLNMQSIDGRLALPPYVRKPEAAAIGNNRQKRDRNTPRDLSFAPICNAGDKQFSSKQKSSQKDGNKSTPRVSVRHPLPVIIGSSPESERGSHGISQPVDSGCALYLLSSRPTQASELGLSCFDFLPQEEHYPCLKEKPAFPEDMAFQTRGHDGFFEDQLPTSWE